MDPRSEPTATLEIEAAGGGAEATIEPLLFSKREYLVDSTGLGTTTSCEQTAGKGGGTLDYSPDD